MQEGRYRGNSLGFLDGLLKSPDSGPYTDSHLLCDFTPRFPGSTKRGDLIGIDHGPKACLGVH